MKRFISIFFAHKVLFARKKFFVFIPFWKKYRVCFIWFPSGRLPRFARNDRVLRTEYNKCLFTRIYLQNFRAIFIISRATHFMSLRGIANGDAVAISRKGSILQNPRKILSYLRGEKAHKVKEWVLSPLITRFQKCSLRRGQVMEKYRIMPKADYNRINYLCKIHNKTNRINIVRY